jgi:hypothetical protein
MASPLHHIERLSPENIHQLVPLFRDVFGKKVSLSHIRGKYERVVDGKSHYGFIGFDGANRPVAFHGCVPYRVAYKDIVETGAQFGDAMTLKSYNGKGIFTLLGKMTEELLAADGIHFAYGLPNQNSEYGYINKLKWITHERLLRFHIPVRAFPLERIMRRSGFETLYQRFVRNRLRPFLCEDRVLPNSAIDSEHAGVVHDEEFFRYKTYTPNHVIQIGGVKMWIKAQGILLVGDMDAQDEKQVLSAIEELRKLASRLGIGEIVLQLHPGTEQEKFMSRHFRSYPSFPVCYNPFSTKIPLEKLRLVYGDIDTF